MGKGHILIVDDEESLVKSLVGLLYDEGFTVSCATDGNQALALIRKEVPDLILLDIWLPGMDGIETLQALHKMDTHIAVIVISGHGNIQSAVKVTKLGAFDYIEKPFAPEFLLRTIHQALHRQSDGSPQDASSVSPTPTHDLMGDTLQLNALRYAETGNHSRVSRHSEPVKRRRHRKPHPLLQTSPQHKQKTLRRSIVLYGQGLQTGLKTAIILSPLPPNRGIIFSNITTAETLPAAIAFVESTEFSTSLCRGRFTARTVEHLLSVLHAYRISNLLIKMSDEIPIMDGSATDFCEFIEKGGIVEQNALAEEFVVDRCYHIGDMRPGAKFIAVEPYDGFRVTYRLDYPRPLGVQEFTYEHRDGTSYRCEVAPARTFGFVKDIETLHDMGLVAGGRLNNVILLDGEKIVNGAELRFPDECARHKVLDLIGDLYLLGKPLRGHVRANMTGHTENAALVKKLHDAMQLSAPFHKCL